MNRWIRRALPALAATGLTLIAGAAAAQTAPQAGRGRATLDANGDGVIDQEELRAARRTAFALGDADRDGYLTRDEQTAVVGDVEARTRGVGLIRRFGGAAETAQERFERLDANADGRISEEEFVAAPHPLLRFDTDGDGRLTRAE